MISLTLSFSHFQLLRNISFAGRDSWHLKNQALPWYVTHWQQHYDSIHEAKPELWPHSWSWPHSVGHRAPRSAPGEHSSPDPDRPMARRRAGQVSGAVRVPDEQRAGQHRMPTSRSVISGRPGCVLIDYVLWGHRVKNAANRKPSRSCQALMNAVSWLLSSVRWRLSLIHL